MNLFGRVSRHHQTGLGYRRRIGRLSLFIFLRLLAVTEGKRSALLPDVPTVGETVPGYVMSVWYGAFGPAGMPRTIVAKLNAEISRILFSPRREEKDERHCCRSRQDDAGGIGHADAHRRRQMGQAHKGAWNYCAIKKKKSDCGYRCIGAKPAMETFPMQKSLIRRYKETIKPILQGGPLFRDRPNSL